MKLSSKEMKLIKDILKLNATLDLMNRRLTPGIEKQNPVALANVGYAQGRLGELLLEGLPDLAVFLKKIATLSKTFDKYEDVTCSLCKESYDSFCSNYMIVDPLWKLLGLGKKEFAHLPCVLKALKEKGMLPMDSQVIFKRHPDTNEVLPINSIIMEVIQAIKEGSLF